MELYSRFQCEVADARDRVTTMQHEAAQRRLVRQLGAALPWRSRLAAQLHALAEHLEPHPDPQESPL